MGWNRKVLSALDCDSGLGRRDFARVALSGESSVVLVRLEVQFTRKAQHLHDTTALPVRIFSFKKYLIQLSEDSLRHFPLLCNKIT